MVNAGKSGLTANRLQVGLLSWLCRASIQTSPIARRVVFGCLVAVFTVSATAQSQYTPPPPPPPASALSPSATPPPPPVPPLSQKELDQLVSRIALYPDPLLEQVLTASTYWKQIPEAAEWADQHSYLTGKALTNAIREDSLHWDPSVLALVPFPSVLDVMAKDQAWTRKLGSAVMTQRAEVVDAAQRMRKEAYQYGYLRTSPYEAVVDSGGYLEILPVNPAYIYVPAYDPLVVFGPPAPGFVVGGAIRFNPTVVVGTAFAPWGWTHPYLEWRTHRIFFDYTPWNRVWVNRGYYVHPYERPWVPRPGPRVERHELRRR